MCIEITFFWDPCRYIAIMCRKIAFFGLCAEIILSSDKVSLDSRAGPFLGVCRNIGFSEKYSPLQYHLPAHWEEAVCPLDPVVDLSAGSLSSQVVHWSLVNIGCAAAWDSTGYCAGNHSSSIP